MAFILMLFIVDQFTTSSTACTCDLLVSLVIVNNVIPSTYLYVVIPVDRNLIMMRKRKNPNFVQWRTIVHTSSSSNSELPTFTHWVLSPRKFPIQCSTYPATGLDLFYQNHLNSPLAQWFFLCSQLCH